MKVQVRVVADTNSWVSAFIGKHSLVAQRLARLVANPRVKLLFSQELHDEVLRVVQRPKFSKYASPEDLHDYTQGIKAFKLLPVTSVVAVCRDPKDDYLLALCLDGHADFLITGDRDLLVLKAFGSTRIISWAEAELELLVS